MTTLSIVAPVIISLLIGYLCKVTGFLSEEGITNIKKYITGIAIPVLVFHAVGVADYSSRTLIIFCVMLADMFLALLIGHLLKRIVKESVRRYFPFLVTVYEGGMLCYPLYQNLCGEEYFSNIVIIDLAACVFVFGVYLGMIRLVDQKVPFSLKKLCLNAIRTPSFLTLVLGLICGISGLMSRFLATPVAAVYTSVKEMVVAPISPMILLCVGYSLSLSKDLILEVLKTVAVRFTVQMLLMGVTLLLLKNFDLDRYMLAAFYVYFVSTPNFNPGTIVKDPQGSQYIATTTSLYCAITIIGYCLIASVMF